MKRLNRSVTCVGFGIAIFASGAAAQPSGLAHQAYLKASGTGAFDGFGFSVAASGDTVVVGAFQEDSGATGVGGDSSDNSVPSSGAAYVYAWNGDSWVQQAYLKSSNTQVSGAFGFAVAISGDTVVVGAPIENNHVGAAYVFTRSGSIWRPQATLTSASPDSGDNFGQSVSISGDTVVVGVPAEDSGAAGVNGDASDNGTSNSGAALVFTRAGTSWSQQAYLKASNPGNSDLFGRTISVSGDTVVVAASGEESSATGVDGNQADDTAPMAGAAYVFTRSGTIWSQQAYLKASNTQTLDQFGISAAISGDTVIVGAIGEDSASTGVDGDPLNEASPNSGAAYVFGRNGATWTQAAYLKASNTETVDLFGFSVAASEHALIVGAYGERSSATGVNGDETDNSLQLSGAAYVFVPSAGSWVQQAYLKSSAPDPLDFFGWSVATSGDTAVVGARAEDSGATGIGGDPNDDGTKDAGAANVFRISPWTDLGFALAGTNGLPVLTGSGALVGGSSGSLELSSAAPNRPAVLFISTASNPTPLLGGTLVPVPFLGPFFLMTDGGGTVPLEWAAWPLGLPAGTALYFQYVIDDPAAAFGAALSNGMLAETP